MDKYDITVILMNNFEKIMREEFGQKEFDRASKILWNAGLYYEYEKTNQAFVIYLQSVLEVAVEYFREEIKAAVARKNFKNLRGGFVS